MSKKLLAVALLCLVSKSANAAGFASYDQSATYLGNAYAGTCSATQDASTGYYNPAGLVELPYTQLLGGATYTLQNLKLYDAFAQNNAGNVISGNDPSKSSSNMLIPFGHFAWHLSKKFSLSFSIIEPFALKTNYASADIVRIMATDNRISTMDLSPAFGFKISPNLSIGAGLDILKVNTKLSSGVAWGTGFAESNGYVIMAANAWAAGYHVGILFKPYCQTQIGLTYFSSFKPKFSANVSSAETSEFFATNATYSLNLPDHVNLGITQQFKSKFTAMAEVEWTHWSKLKTLVINYNGGTLPGLKSFYYQNTWRASIGGDYKFNHKFTLKGGFAYDQSPANNTYRSAMVPDSDQYILGVGARLNLHKQISIVAGYAYVFYHNASIAETGAIDGLNNSSISTPPNLSVLDAKVKNSANKFGLQLVLNLVK